MRKSAVNPRSEASPIAQMHPDETLPTTVGDSWLTEVRAEKHQQEDKEIKNHLIQLDVLRQECERHGNFRKAQRCVDRIREINLRYAKKIEIEARKVNVGWKRQMMEEQQLELLTFHEMWEDKMKDYDEKADDLLYQLNRQHMMDMQSQEDIIRLGLMEKRLRPSKTLVDLRDELKNFVQQRMYADAEHVQKKIVQREAEELHEFEVEQERKLQERLLAVAERLRVERGAVEQRLAMNREELLAERRQDFDALVKRHSAALRGQEQATALIISRAQDCIHRQVKAYIKDPVKTGLELVHLSETVLGRRSRGDHSAVEWGASGRQGTSWRSSAHRQITERVPSPGQTPLRAVVAARPPWQD